MIDTHFLINVCIMCRGFRCLSTQIVRKFSKNLFHLPSETRAGGAWWWWWRWFGIVCKLCGAGEAINSAEVLRICKLVSIAAVDCTFQGWNTDFLLHGKMLYDRGLWVAWKDELERRDFSLRPIFAAGRFMEMIFLVSKSSSGSPKNDDVWKHNLVMTLNDI